MTGREKIEAAFAAAGTPRAAAVICYSSIYYRDHWAQLTDQPWWALQSGDLARHLAVHRDRIRNVGQDWFHLPFGPTRRERENIVIAERADGVFRVDRRSGEERRLEPRPVSGWWKPGLHSPRPTRDIRTPADIDALPPPPATPADLAAPFENGADELTRTLLATDARDLFPMGGTSSPLWSGCYGLWTFDDMMAKYIDAPGLIRHACERRLERLLPGIEQQARLGCRGVWIEECMTDMISPAAYREFNLPYLRRVVETIRDCGMLSVYYYCGNPNDRLDLLLESGADALSLEEGKKGWEVDIARVARFVDGRAVLLGNLDAITLLERGSEAQLRAEITRQLAAGRRNGRRFVMSIGSPVTPGATVERVRRYGELVHEMGTY